MDVSVTEFKQRCLKIIHRVESTGEAVTLTRRGRVVAQLQPPTSLEVTPRPWERLRALGGRLHAKAHESVLRDEDFRALR